MKYTFSRFFLVVFLFWQVITELAHRTVLDGRFRYAPFDSVQFNSERLITVLFFALQLLTFIAILLTALRIRVWRPITLRIVIGIVLAKTLFTESMRLLDVNKIIGELYAFDYINLTVVVLPLLFAFLLSLAFKEGEDKRLKLTFLLIFPKSLLKTSAQILQTIRTPRSENGALIGDIQKLHELHLSGVLSEEEFNAAKKRVLGQ